MSRCTIIPTMIICCGLSVIAFSQSENAGSTPAVTAASSTENVELVSSVRALEDRVLHLERKIAEKRAEPTLKSGQVSIEPIIVNLTDVRMSRYLKLHLVLVVADADTQVANRAISDLRTNIRDAVMIQLSDSSAQNLAGSDNQKALKVDLAGTINQQLKSAGHPEYVKAILFDEFYIQ